MTESHKFLQLAWLVYSMFIELPSLVNITSSILSLTTKPALFPLPPRYHMILKSRQGTMIQHYRYFALVSWLILTNFLLTIQYLYHDLGSGTPCVSSPTLNNSTQVIKQLSSSTLKNVHGIEDLHAVDLSAKYLPSVQAFKPKFRTQAVEKARKLLKDEMRGLIFPSNKSLSDFVIEDGGHAVLSLVFTTWRSGSTFVGDILHSHPGTYYHFEPLLHFGNVQVREGESSKEALRVLRELLNCRYASLADYMKNAAINNQVLYWNKRIWSICTPLYQVCLDPEWLSTMCRMLPFQAVKTVRMRLDLARSLLEDEKLNVRVLYLVRDPRGTIQSRSHQEWCRLPDCENPEHLCKDLVSDFHAAQRLRQDFRDRFMIVRYEDMAGNVYSATKKILKFFQFQYHPQVKKYLDEHTRSNVGGDSSTFRDTKSAPFHWMQDMSSNFTAVETIQNSCWEAMALWGYDVVKSLKELEGFNPVLDAPWKDMNIPPDA